MCNNATQEPVLNRYVLCQPEHVIKLTSFLSYDLNKETQCQKPLAQMSLKNVKKFDFKNYVEVHFSGQSLVKTNCLFSARGHVSRYNCSSTS